MVEINVLCHKTFYIQRRYTTAHYTSNNNLLHLWPPFEVGIWNYLYLLKETKKSTALY